MNKDACIVSNYKPVNVNRTVAETAKKARSIKVQCTLVSDDYHEVPVHTLARTNVLGRRCL